MANFKVYSLKNYNVVIHDPYIYKKSINQYEKLKELFNIENKSVRRSANLRYIFLVKKII